MEFPSMNNYLTPPYPPFIVPMPRGMPPFTDKDGKPTLPNGATPPQIPYGVPYFPPPPGQGPPTNPNAMFGGHPYPLIGNYLPPQYHRFYQDHHFLYFPPDMKLPSKFTPMKGYPEQMTHMPRDNRLAAEKKVKKKPKDPKEEKEPKKEKPKKKRKTNYCICERPEDGKFMVGCDVCDNWFHPKCVNISKKIAKTLDYFVCPHCKDFIPEEDRMQAMEQQNPPKKKKRESVENSPGDEESFDFLEQLSNAAALQELESEEEQEQIETKRRTRSETDLRPANITFQSVNLMDKGHIEISKDNILSYKECDEYLEKMIESTAWEQEEIQMYGTTYLEPRLTAWYGDVDCNYSHHGITRTVLPWTEVLLQIKARVEEICECKFNNALVNYYRNGEDYMGFHDEQTVQGSKTKIASVSLGSERNFIVKHRNTDEVHSLKISNGSLLVMFGEETAKHYIYSVPKARGSTGPRINLMLRCVEPVVKHEVKMEDIKSELSLEEFKRGEDSVPQSTEEKGSKDSNLKSVEAL